MLKPFLLREWRLRRSLHSILQKHFPSGILKRAISGDNVFSEKAFACKLVQNSGGDYSSVPELSLRMWDIKLRESVQVMRSEGLRRFVTSEDLNNRPGQFLCG
jgi:hypothetical protein